jgi:hypothetical protein
VTETERSRYLPDADRMSVLAAALLLAFALSHFVDLPLREVELQLPGFYIDIRITLKSVVALLAAGMTASGADWLLRDHPALQDRSTIQHWLLPALTAWVIGMPLFQLPFGITWWIVFSVGAVLLMLVLVAEYISVDPEDLRYVPASAGLTAVSFALLFMLAVVLHAVEARLFLTLPPLALASGLVCARTLHLRLQGQWRFWEALVVAVVVSQVAAALHYWPLSPIAYGLAVLGPAYALTSLVSGLVEGDDLLQALREPGMVLVLSWGAAAWMR